MKQRVIDDLVTIRSWDDMMAEFGPDKDGDISCPGCFVQDMKNLVNTLFRVRGWNSRRTKNGRSDEPGGRCEITGNSYDSVSLAKLFKRESLNFLFRDIERLESDIISHVRQMPVKIR